ncbi:MAG: hypothetical protein BGO21_05265 [Dyadobacter sp. 50-39]|uniref:efflux RND transporter periplasmic adaptor subunit n=1 Tax=Dyadobacter sp. 50-39 TaxID=1895756 RepID=UPI000969998A|nr:efflux RND transporter periplasmic adaptor subunit [Dyadobacter sp. 50-39]OJV22567.1 MAG: hypothetical protein BGO21_05265 [Dyadobacter sp. 50-39]
MSFSARLPSMITSGLLTVSCAGGEQQPVKQDTARIPVKISVVKASNNVFYDEYPATLIARKSIEIRPLVTGFVTKIHVKDGASVREGQLLYSLDPEYHQAVFEHALAQWRASKASHGRAEKDAARYRALLSARAIATQLADNAEADLRVASSELARACAAVNAAQASLRYVNISAPFSGIVGISNARVGSAVVAGQTVLNTISVQEGYSAEFFADQSEVHRFDSLQTKGAKQSPFFLRLGDQIFPDSGRLVLLDRIVDPNTGRIRVRVSFDDPEQRLRVGMSAIVRVRYFTAQGTIMVPASSVTEQLGEHFVYVCGIDSTVNQRRIVRLRKTGDSIAISAGLKPGERIVISGIENLRQGAKVLMQQ